jgi:hypothetical protein
MRVVLPMFRLVVRCTGVTYPLGGRPANARLSSSMIWLP